MAQPGLQPAIRVLLASFLLAMLAATAPADPVHAQQAPPAEATEPALDPTLVNLSAVTGLREDVLRALAAPADAHSTLSTVQQVQADEMRQRLADWIDEMQLVFPELTEDVLPRPEGYLGAVESGLDDLRPQDLLLLDALYGSHPGFWELPGLLRAQADPEATAPLWYQGAIREWHTRGAIDDAEARRLGVQPPVRGSAPQLYEPASPQQSVPTPNPTATVPFPTMPEFPPRGDLPAAPDDRAGCPGSFGSVNCSGCPIFIPAAVIFALEQALTIADAVTAAIDADIDMAIAPACVVAPVPNPAYYIANSIRVALGYTISGLQFNNELANNCVEGLHRGLQNLFLDATISSRVTQASHDAHAMLQLRIDIENDLLKDADDHVAIFQLPQFRCSDAVPDDTLVMTRFEGFRFCGKLEMARLIANQTVRDNADAGMLTDVNDALAEIAAGDAHYELGEWRSAYQRYSRAYRRAVQEDL